MGHIKNIVIKIQNGDGLTKDESIVAKESGLKIIKIGDDYFVDEKLNTAITKK